MDSTEFLNIDLDLESESDLSSIIESFQSVVSVMRNDVKDGVHFASFETPYSTIEQIIEEYYRLVKNLSPEDKIVWDGCRVKRFDFGYECGLKPYAYYSTIPSRLVSILSELGGEIGITIYAHNPENT